MGESKNNLTILYRIETATIGGLKPFDSEFEMETFLKHHPSLLLPAESEDNNYFDIFQQYVIRLEKGKHKRLDLAVLSSKEKKVKIFELKNRKIEKEDIEEQLKPYLKNWQTSVNKEKITKKYEEILSEKEITEILSKSNIEGFMVGPSFCAEAIKSMVENNIKGIRLARFQHKENLQESFVLVEDVVGDNVSSTRRKIVSWIDLIDRKLITDKDKFYLDAGKAKTRVWGKPSDVKFRRGKKVTLEPESRDLILKHEEKIKSDFPVDTNKDAEKALKHLKAEEDLSLTLATCLAFYAFDNDSKYYWSPSYEWKRCKDGKKIADLDLKCKGIKK